MMLHRWSETRLRVRITTKRITPLLFMLTLSLASCRSSGEVVTYLARASPAPPPLAPDPSPALTPTLAECLRLALERQPRIAAQRASLAAAEEGLRAVQTLRF